MTDFRDSTGLIWSGYATAPRLVLLIFGLATIGIWMGSEELGGWLGTSLLNVPLVAIVLTFLFVRVNVTAEAVVISLGTFGYPRFVRPLGEIQEACSISVHPLRVGGWGYRLIRGGSAVVIRGGEAVELRMKSGGRLVVTVDGADGAADCINGLITDGAAPTRGDRGGHTV